MSWGFKDPVDWQDPDIEECWMVGRDKRLSSSTNALHLQEGWCGVKLHTVINGRKCNDNMEKDMTPFPDQEQIRHDVARAKYWSKKDLLNAYEKICVEPKDVWKTVFATIYGTFVSHTMQQGDYNAPATFQQLMTVIFQDYIRGFVHVYLDDIFVYSNSIEEHEKHLELIFDKLCQAHLYFRGE